VWDAADSRNRKIEDEGKYGFLSAEQEENKEGKRGNVHGAFTVCYQAPEDHLELMPRENAE